MSMVSLPGLTDMINVISRERNLPKHAVEAALKEALLKRLRTLSSNSALR